MIAHLFSKVYLNFDIALRTTFDTLIVSKDAFTVHKSFINNHVGIGEFHGRYTDASKVNWPEFFNSVGDKRTVVYVDPKNFAVIYFSFLKTINPDITFDNAKKIVEVTLKRAHFYFVDYTAFGTNSGAEARQDISNHITKVRESYDAAWAASTAWDLTPEFITNNLGIEYLVARYWADGSNEQLVKDRLETIWWKIFVSWGEESMKNYAHRWLHQNPGTSPDSFNAVMSTHETLSWMADPNMDLERTDLFKQDHDWSAVEAIWAFLQSDQDKGLIIETEPHWETVVARDWAKILDKSNPMTLNALASEPIYRVLVNSWLISYFANLPKAQLKEFVL